MGNPVFVECLTFNHANYIEDAMRGFVMQQTNFPYVAVVVDDASTDGEPEVIKQFLEKEFDMHFALQDETEDYVRVVAKHKTNENCTFVVVFLKYNHYSIQKPKWKYYWNWRKNAKYITLCEGDDYWTDPLKLQKQVDFLETHPEYSLCCHRYKIHQLDDDSWKEDYVADLFENNNKGITFTSSDNYRCCWFTKTMTVMYRREAFDSQNLPKFKYFRDVHMFYYILQKGLGYCMPDNMAVYNVHQTGIYSCLTNKEKGKINVLVYSELSEGNKQDEDLFDYSKMLLNSYFQEYVRIPLHNRSRDVSYKDIKFTIDLYKRFKGKKAALYVIEKSLKSYLCLKKR